MLVPILPLYLLDQSFSGTAIGVVLAAAGLGGMLAQLPVGRLLGKRSETEVMVIGILLLAVSVAALGLVGTAVALASLRLVGGMGRTGWLLSRQTFLTRTVPDDIRGTAMSLFGGTTRISFLVGPLIGGAMAQQFGFATAFAVSGATTAAGLVPLLAWQPADSMAQPPKADSVSPPPPKLDARILLIAGIGQLLIISARQGRFVVLPLIGASVGMRPLEVAGLITATALPDLLLFPVAGHLMDKFGRLAAIVPAFTIMGLGLIVLALAPSTSFIVVAAVVMGIGNGLSSGSMLTLASDLAPPEAPAKFLAALGTIRDGGTLSGPFIVGWVTDLAGERTSSTVLGLVAFAGIAVLGFGVGETKSRHKPMTAPVE